MSGSEQPTIQDEPSLTNIKPIQVFEYPCQATKIIWNLDSNNFIQSSSQIIDLIKTNKISIKMSLRIIDVFSRVNMKKLRYFADLYKKLSDEFSTIIEPENDILIALLHYKGMFETFKPRKTKEEFLNIYPKESPLYYIIWDKVDDLKSKFPNLNVEMETDYHITPLDCAIKFGSELCFFYLKNKGAKYTDSSAEYAVQGGNQNIFMQMIEDGKSFDNMISIALRYRNYEIAEYLKTNLDQIPNSLVECLIFGNYEIASYLLSKGTDVNEIYILLLFTFIIIL